MDTFDKWFLRFMYATEIIFLAASMPHIAVWFAHYDNPTDFWSSIYAYVVGGGLALAIDGVAFMVLLAITRMLKRPKFSGWAIFGLLVFMLFIALLSWDINIQYDIQFADTTFAKADAIHVLGTTMGHINPVIAGAFQLLILVYALVGRAATGEQKPAMTEEEYKAEKQRLERERELKELRNTGNKPLLELGKETFFGQGKTGQELLEETLTYLRDARELLLPDREELALQALSTYLKMRAKTVLPLLIQARSIIKREDEQKELSSEPSEIEASHEPFTDEESPDDTPDSNGSVHTSFSDDREDANSLLNGLTGRDTVSIEIAAKVLQCQERHVLTLRNDGKLKHGPKRKDLITVASLRAYLATRKRRGPGANQPSPAITPVQESGNTDELTAVTDKLTLAIEAIQQNADITDEELAVILNINRPASARFWKLKAIETLNGKLINV